MMKKLIATISLVTILSLSAFADGNMGIGGKSCPPNTSCLVSADGPDTKGAGSQKGSAAEVIFGWFETVLAKLVR